MANPVVHFEIGCRDQPATAAFYRDLFGWSMQTAGPATTIQAASGAGKSTGISGHLTSLGHEPYHYTMFYVEVDDIAAYLAKAVELGGKKVVGPVPIPTGKFAWFTDPEGNQIGLLQNNP